MSAPSMTASCERKFDGRAFVRALGFNVVWINLSEIVRYFVFVMPMMREALPTVPDAAPMSGPVFLVWGVWDTLLLCAATFLSFLMLERFGASVRVAVAAGTVVWATVFVILWLALYNMNLVPLSLLGVALPLAWVEMVVAALIVRRALGAAPRAHTFL